MALGAAQAAKDLNKTIVIVGFDYTPDGKAAIERGELFASIAQSPETMGKLAIQSAAALMGGNTVPPNQPVPLEVKRK
jgi:ribose transport system substrate-binding protein